ncbi:MAG: pentapeptide repeat-containing protein [Nitrosomonas sp.]
MPSKKTPSNHKTKKSPHLIVSKPISLLQRDIKIDLGGLFKALGKSIAHMGTGKTWELAADLGDAAAAIDLQKDPGGLAWYLIRQALLRAMRELVGEAWLHRQQSDLLSLEELEAKLDEQMEKMTLEVTSSFFRQPGNLAFIQSCSALFVEWLTNAGFDEPTAATIGNRLRSYFVYALNQEWRSKPELYAPIVAASTTPFTPAGEHERAWEQYQAWLEQELDSPMFGEPFSLRQLYIPLRAYYQRGLESALELSSRHDQGRKRIAVDLTKNLLDWVNQLERQDAVRVISGGPGSGKSSLAKMLTAQILEKTSWRALYIPLHRIQYKGDIVPAIEDYLKRTGLMTDAPRFFDGNNGESKIVVIFDGLDELAMFGKIAQENVSGFVRAMKDWVRDRNTLQQTLKVVLTGRTVVMQSLESEFRTEGAVLHLCPYFVEESEKENFESGWGLLSKVDQRQEWWQKYGNLTGRGYQGLPEHFNRDDLLEINSEPLLNYLLALADQTNTLDFSKPVTQNQIYASLIQEIYDRRWAGGEHFAVRGMKFDHFQRVLEEVAVAAWHGDGRKTTVGEIKRHCQDAGIAKMLETFQDGAESGVLRLLTAFFFRQAGVREDENAFEFTHKSFGEYLVARRMVRMIDIIEKKTEEQQCAFTGWDERKCLEEWARLCGPSAMTERQLELLINEMHRDEAQPAAWQSLLIALINHLLHRGMPMEKLELKDFYSMQYQSRNAEEALLISLNACARFTRKVSEILWPQPSSAGAWFKHLQGQRLGPENVLVMSGLNFLSFNEQILDMIDFGFADLRFCTFTKTHLNYACLVGANLEEANLESARLSEAILTVANLDRADLVGANLERAILIKANLEGANLEGIFLKGANFVGVQ